MTDKEPQVVAYVLWEQAAREAVGCTTGQEIRAILDLYNDRMPKGFKLGLRDDSHPQSYSLIVLIRVSPEGE